MRMNRLVVRQAAAGLGRWLLDAEADGTIPDAAQRGVVIAHDARRKSDLFADDTARVLAAMGIRSMLHPGVQPTPVLAWSITGLEAAAGVVVTASHNPPADNGYKVYLDTGSQIVSADRHRHRRPDRAVRPADGRARAGRRSADRAARRRRGSIAYVEFVPSVRLRPDVPGVSVAYTAMHGVGGAHGAAERSRRRASSRRSWSPSSRSPTARSRPCRSRIPRSRGRWTCCSTRRGRAAR